MTGDGLTGQQRQNICQVLARFPAVRGARLYGSRALGRYRPGSDIDLTLEGDIDLTTLNRISMALDDLLLPYEIDLSVFGQIDSPELRDHIQRVGRLFYQKSEPSKNLESPNRAGKISG
ncbi:nucleotidyltransferase domain-containing protein [Nitrosococcus watsonii]|uniref:DNA polymerase beta domain protein region n=1 Tax=Nitrosococcus watsoni (strain C-113) TaxID=105559 RepID=D8KC51_NITWC|nr:nucleotidyltransferase domain-containing protein [Nitrosococcus watsonii]ADJ29722.1 DNA polymerase beta domain protein region [Nitrosococcus watsonii C-113]